VGAGRKMVENNKGNSRYEEDLRILIPTNVKKQVKCFVSPKQKHQNELRKKWKI
jgi:hypothetical protein